MRNYVKRLQNSVQVFHVFKNVTLFETEPSLLYTRGDGQKNRWTDRRTKSVHITVINTVT